MNIQSYIWMPLAVDWKIGRRWVGFDGWWWCCVCVILPFDGWCQGLQPLWLLPGKVYAATVSRLMVRICREYACRWAALWTSWLVYFWIDKHFLCVINTPSSQPSIYLAIHSIIHSASQPLVKVKIYWNTRLHIRWELYMLIILCHRGRSFFSSFQGVSRQVVAGNSGNCGMIG